MSERLISADKLIKFMMDEEQASGFFETDKGHKAFCILCEEINSGTFDPTPPTVPDINPGDKVRHKDKRLKYLNVGNVIAIAASGKTAQVEWPNYDKTKCNWPPYPAYYRLDKLEVIPNE